MAVEVKEFREKLRAWLLGITGMATYVGTSRVFSIWPAEKPTFPMMTFAFGRRPPGDYPQSGWSARLALRIYADNEDSLDAIEDLILSAAADDDVAAALSGTNCLTAGISLSDIAEDEPTFSMEDGSYMVLMRQVSFDVVFSEEYIP